MEPDTQTGTRSHRWKVWVAIVSPAALWLLWGAYGVPLVAIWHFGLPTTLAELGQAGDIFGGINALFAAYALVAATLAAFFQYRSFQQVQEQQKIQSSQLAQQSFEPLFQYLLQQRERTTPEKISVVKHEMDAPAPLRVAMINLSDELESLLQRTWTGSENSVSNRFNEWYSDVYEKNEDRLGPYFRALFHVFTFIDESGLSRSTRIRYANLARSTLSASELAILALNCSSKYGLREFGPLVEAYGLLKHLPNVSNPKMSGIRRIAEKMLAPTSFLSTDEREAHWAQNETKRPLTMRG